MDTPMHPTWYMGHQLWFELALFGLLAVIVVTLLAQCQLRRPVPSIPTPTRLSQSHQQWSSVPELQLLMFSLPLELLWEIAQFPLYTVWQEGEWSYILYGLVHCTLGDLLILLLAYWLVSLLNRNRHWYIADALLNGFLLVVFGLGYTVYSEIVNVSIKGNWAYTELMPIIPGIEIGGMPFLQWLLIPPLVLWLMRMFAPRTAIPPEQD